MTELWATCNGIGLKDAGAGRLAGQAVVFRRRKSARIFG
jgi:hypothetical protein